MKPNVAHFCLPFYQAKLEGLERKLAPQAKTGERWQGFEEHRRSAQYPNRAEAIAAAQQATEPK